MHRSEAEGTRERSEAPEGAARRCAGFPSPAEQYLEPPLDLNELLVKRPAATFFVKVEGDSMINAGIHARQGSARHLGAEDRMAIVPRFWYTIAK